VVETAPRTAGMNRLARRKVEQAGEIILDSVRLPAMADEKRQGKGQ
jgi:hypothetical protein